MEQRTFFHVEFYMLFCFFEHFLFYHKNIFTMTSKRSTQHNNVERLYFILTINLMTDEFNPLSCNSFLEFSSHKKSSVKVLLPKKKNSKR
jgi:hypothetical protein